MPQIEIEITRLSPGWVEGRICNPTDEARYLAVPLESVLAPPNIPGQDNGHVFRPVRGIARRIDEPWLKVGDFVMVLI